ncbi:beta strand repeat-containing protein, partial [Thermodesulfobacteriota bacterium]
VVDFHWQYRGHIQDIGATDASTATGWIELTNNNNDHWVKNLQWTDKVSGDTTVATDPVTSVPGDLTNEDYPNQPTTAYHRVDDFESRAHYRYDAAYSRYEILDPRQHLNYQVVSNYYEIYEEAPVIEEVTATEAKTYYIERINWQTKTVYQDEEVTEYVREVAAPVQPPLFDGDSLAANRGSITITAEGDVRVDGKLNAAGSLNIGADLLQITIPGGIDVNTAVNSLMLTTTEIGDVTVTESDDIEHRDVDILNGVFHLNAGGSITAYEGSRVNANNVTLVAGASLAANVTTDHLDATAAVDMNLLTTVTSLDAAILGGGNMVVTETDSIFLNNVTAQDGTITVTAANIMIDYADAGIGSGVFNAVASGDIYEVLGAQNDPDVDVTANEIGFIAGGTLYLWTGNLDPDLEILPGSKLSMDIPGDIDLDGTLNVAFDLIVEGRITATNFDSNGNDISLTARNDDILIGYINAGPGMFTAQAARDIREIDEFDVGYDLIAGETTLIAGRNIGASSGSELNLETDIASLTAESTGLWTGQGTGTGSIFIDEGSALDLNAVTALNGSIMITTGGTITAMNISSLTDATGNDVSLTAATGDILIDYIGVGTVSGNISLSAADGLIGEVPTEDPEADLVAGTLNLISATGIGSLGQLEIDVTTLTHAEVTGSGAINLMDTAGGLLVTIATTADGSVNIGATDGNLVVTTVTALGNNRDVALSTLSSGNIRVGNVSAANDTIILTSAGAIEELGPADTAADITALSIALRAATGIGSLGALETS